MLGTEDTAREGLQVAKSSNNVALSNESIFLNWPNQKLRTVTVNVRDPTTLCPISPQNRNNFEFRPIYLELIILADFKGVSRLFNRQSLRFFYP